MNHDRLSVEFIEAPVFTQLLAEYLRDDEYRELQLHLARDLEAGDVKATGLTPKEKRALKAAVVEEKRQRARRRSLRRK